MKKIFSIAILFGIAMSFTACVHEEDDIFDKSAAERLNEVSQLYTGRLAASEAGWAMEYYPTNDNSNPTGMGYLMCVDFDPDGTVLVAMNNSDITDGFESDRSLWEIITDNGPVLSFCTYNKLLHYFSDPAIYNTGTGLEGDYEFVMVDVPEDGDHVMLKGKKRSTYVRLTKLAAGTDFEEYLSDVKSFLGNVIPASAPNKAYITLGGEKYCFEDVNSGLPNIYPKGGDAISNEYRLPFLVTKRNGKYYLRFRTALSFDNGEETEEEPASEQEFEYDETNDMFVGVENSENTITGADPAEFFADAIEDEHSWFISYENDMAETLATPLTTLATTLKSNYNYNFKGLEITMKDDRCIVYMVYRTVNKKGKESSSDSKAGYYYTYERGENNAVKIAYDSPYNSAAETIYNLLPSLQEVLNVVSSTYVASAAGSAFNITEVKVSSTANTNLWFNATYKR